MRKLKRSLKKTVKFIFSFQFSKLLVLFELVIVAYLTHQGIELAEQCISNQFSGSLPWIATMVASAWAAYGVSAGFYYSKSKGEQLAKIDKFGVETPIIGLEDIDPPTI